MSVNNTPAVTTPNYDSGNESDHSVKSINDGKYYSPYADSKIVILEVGVPVSRFIVHSHILRQIPPLFALASDEKPIILSGLDARLAHTLVHHLYTGTFDHGYRYSLSGQLLNSTRVYSAAVRYELCTLVELAKREIIHTSESLPISTILTVARVYAFPTLPGSDTWYAQYLETVIQKAMKTDPEPFKQSNFITTIEGNTRLLQIVWKTVMSSYTAAPVSIHEEQDADSVATNSLDEKTRPESDVEAQDSQHQLPSPTESVVDSSPHLGAADESYEPEALDLGLSETSGTDALARSNIGDSSAYGHTVVLNDDFDLPSIEPVIIEVKIPQTSAISDENIKTSRHTRADSVMDRDPIVSEGGLESTKREGLDEAAQDASMRAQESRRKSKKKCKKRHSSIAF